MSIDERNGADAGYRSFAFAEQIERAGSPGDISDIFNGQNATGRLPGIKHLGANVFSSLLQSLENLTDDTATSTSEMHDTTSRTVALDTVAQDDRATHVVWDRKNGSSANGNHPDQLSAGVEVQPDSHVTNPEKSLVTNIYGLAVSERDYVPMDPKTRADVALHVLSDGLRVAILSVLARHPEGISGVALREELDPYLTKDQSSYVAVHRQQIDWWFIPMGLVETEGRDKQGTLFSYKLTTDGMAMAAVAGHLVEWALKPSGVGFEILGVANKGNELSTKGLLPKGRQRIECFDYLAQHSRDYIRPSSLAKLPNSSRTLALSAMQQMVKAGWLIGVPGPMVEANKYPLIEPGFARFDYSGLTFFERAFHVYLRNQWEQSKEPINPHDLTNNHEHPLRSLLDEGSNDTAFRTAVFQAIAKLQAKSRRYVFVVRQPVFELKRIAVNPDTVEVMRELVEIVRGAEQTDTADYDAEGVEKLIKHCSRPSQELIKLVGR